MTQIPAFNVQSTLGKCNTRSLGPSTLSTSDTRKVGRRQQTWRAFTSVDVLSHRWWVLASDICRNAAVTDFPTSLHHPLPVRPIVSAQFPDRDMGAPYSPSFLEGVRRLTSLSTFLSWENSLRKERLSLVNADSRHSDSRPESRTVDTRTLGQSMSKTREVGQGRQGGGIYEWIYELSTSTSRVGLYRL